MDDELHQKFHATVDGINRVLAEVFGDDLPAIVVGLQPRGYEPQGDDPTCLVTSNLPVCLIPDAVADMHGEALRLHDEAHGVVREEVTFDSLPADVQEQLRQVAEESEVPLDSMRFVQVADASDLLAADSEQFERGEN